MKGWFPQREKKDVEIKEENLLSQGFYWVRGFLLRYRRFSGEWSPWIKREQIRHGDAVAVLLYDPKKDLLVLVEQLRIGLLMHYPISPWLLEIVAGIVEPQEKLEQTVRRETYEETGCKILHLIKINDFYNSPGGFAEKTTLYCGLIEAPDMGGIYGMGAEHEDILVHILPAAPILAEVEKGAFLTSASTLIALQWLQLQRQGTIFQSYK